MKDWVSRSWLFEIVDTNTKRIERSFTLVLPPQQYTIKEKHRVSIKKTFGNAFIDDYGADNLEITIKGISGTAHVFPTFRTRGVSVGQPLGEVRKRVIGVATRAAIVGYDARGAFYTFRNDIMRYRDREKFDQKELRVYDLHDEQAYKCVLLEFSVDRTAERPLHYPFTINLFVYARLDSKRAARPKKVSFGFDPFAALDALDEAFAWLHNAYRFVKDVQGQVALCTAVVQTLRYKFNTYLTEARAIIESPLRTVKQLLDLTGVVGGLAYDAYSQGKLAFENWAGSREMLQDTIRNTLKIYGFTIEEGAQESKEKIIPKDAGLEVQADGTVSRAAIFDTFTFTGLNVYTVKGEDTLQSIALVQMGNENLWPFVASVNNMRDNEDLVVGEDIHIPVAFEGEVNKDNFIMTEDIARDPYGSDFQIDDEGNIVIAESNDVSLISGLQNVEQAIDLRLSTAIGSMIKQTAYGLIGQPGIAGTDLALKYIRMGLKAALIQDPRIEDIQNINVLVDGDKVQANMDVYVVGYDTTLPVSVVI